ncbi:hypothetical protein ACT3SZ_04820 [Corynebacterium sp. AOP40-9SA-29]|uniref:hypothetical protein n=1 Tax=Corynebacterium sp. AOP40-9SA-29 TaxID=3457677 RepID=UPI004034C383
MGEDELPSFLSSFGGGGREIGIGQNYGQGFKASCYEWNPYGIIVASWTAEDPEGWMIWIHRREEGENVYWELKDFDCYDENGEFQDSLGDCVRPNIVIPGIDIDAAQLKTEQIAQSGHGTVFLFLGSEDHPETMDGDYLRDECQNDRRGIVRYLNSRFLDIPGDVDLTVSTAEAKKDATDTGRRDSKDRYIVHTKANGTEDRRSIHSRRVRGIRSRINGGEDKSMQSGTLRAPRDTTIQWYLTPESDMRKGVSSYNLVNPSIVVKYDDEAYDVKHAAHDFRQFGIPDEIKDRVWIVIDPPHMTEDASAWGVTPQASRGMLISNDGGSLPWAEWWDYFVDNTPEPIEKAKIASQQTEASGDTESRRKRMERLESQFGSRWRSSSLTQSPNGRHRGNPATTSGRNNNPNPTRSAQSTNGARMNGSPSSGPAVKLSSDSAGGELGRHHRSNNGIPEVTWDDDFSADSEKIYAARFDSKDVRNGSHGTIHFNKSFPVFQEEIRYWNSKFPRAIQSEIVDLLHLVYEDELVSKVMHAYRLRNTQVGITERGEAIRIRDQQVDELVSPSALTTAVIGLNNVEMRLNSLGGAKFGKKRN